VDQDPLYLLSWEFTWNKNIILTSHVLQLSSILYRKKTHPTSIFLVYLQSL